MEPTLHQAERKDQRGHRFLALAALLVALILGSAWVGLFGFLGINATWGTAEDVADQYIPDVRPLELDLPDLSRQSDVYTADGILLGTLTERNSQPVPLDEIPDLVIAAALAAEDADFYTHQGIDFRAIVRAAVEDIGGGNRQGGSTLTQQVVKQNFVGDELSLERKAREAVIAAELERRYTKDQILEFYLNSVFFGSNAYGVKAAANEYFGKELDDLTIAEAAALVTPIRNPSLYNPRRNPSIVARTRNAIIDNMAEEGFITEDEADAAKTEPVQTTPPQESVLLGEQVIIDVTRRLLNDPGYGLGESYTERKRAVFGCPANDDECEGGGGLKVMVTLDWELQQEAERILHTWFPIVAGETRPTGAIAMVDNRTGAVTVAAGGLEFGEDLDAGQRPYDLATIGTQNPGSAFKPITLVTALEQGYSLGSYWDWTDPQIIEWLPEDWECNNFSNSGEGIRTLESALVNSTNTVFCQVAAAVGPENIVEMGHRLGISSPLQPFPSITLGTSAVTPLDMAAAYSTIANYGRRVEPYLVERIETLEGEVVYQHTVQPEQVIDRALAAAVVNTMEQVVTSGTGTRANIQRPQAGKTGTHQGVTDVWYVGYIPQYSTAVWVGHADAQLPLRNVWIKNDVWNSASSSRVPAPIWAEFMQIVTEDLPVIDFAPDPDGTGAYYTVPKTEVPDLVGLILDPTDGAGTKAIKSMLYQAGLDIAIEEVPDPEAEAGMIIAQRPEPGSRVSQGEVVTLVVSTGKPPEAPLPDLKGLTLEQAQARLDLFFEETGITLTWQRGNRNVGNQALVGIIVGTNPAADAIVKDGQRIRLIVGVRNQGGGGGGGSGGDG